MSSTQTGARSIKAIRENQAWLRIAQAMVIGYSAMSRTFAYIGIIPLKIFISEIYLGLFLLRRSSAFDWFFLRAKRSRYVETLRISLVAFLLYGIISLLFGAFLQPDNLFAGFQNFAFNYYSLYLVIGIWLGAVQRLNMRQLAMALGWIHGVYGAVWIVILNRLSFEIPGTPGVDAFGQPTGAAIAIITMLSFEPRIRKIAVPVLLNLFVMVGVQVRSEWLGFLIAFTVWSVLARKMSQFSAIIGLVVLLMAVGLMFDIRLPGVANRGGEVSVQGIFGRLIAPFDPQLAAKFVDDAEGLGGTAKWRQMWWDAIWRDINHGPTPVFFFGEGYGFAITDVVQYVEGGIRTPHSIFFYALAYGGWCGVGFFAFFQFTLAWCLYRVYRLTGRPFGITMWVLCMIMALLGNQLETPFGAIPFYLMLGMALKPLFVPREFWEEYRPLRARQFYATQQRPFAYPSPIAAISR